MPIEGVQQAPIRVVISSKDIMTLFKTWFPTHWVDNRERTWMKLLVFQPVNASLEMASNFVPPYSRLNALWELSRGRRLIRRLRIRAL
jgi:hypothetical protein